MTGVEDRLTATIWLTVVAEVTEALGTGLTN